MENLNQFFVYGTLMTNCSNHHLFEEDSIVSIEEVEVSGMELYIYKTAMFPCMVESVNKDNKVYGQLITISEEYLEDTIKHLDRLEGYFEPNSNYNFYERIQGICRTSEGFYKQCHMYLFNTKNKGLGKPIESGNFKQYLSEQEVK